MSRPAQYPSAPPPSDRDEARVRQAADGKLQALDITRALRALHQADDLTASARRVGAAIIDHYNRKTGRCDPGIPRLAREIGASPRTVIRALKKLERGGYLRRHRHGGGFGRNSYTPNWGRFRELDAALSVRMGFRKGSAAPPPLSPPGRQDCHHKGDTGVAQTISMNFLPTNQLNAAAAFDLPEAATTPSPRADGGQAVKTWRPMTPTRHRDWSPTTPSSASVAKLAAGKKVLADMEAFCIANPALREKLYAAATEAMQDAAVEAEFKRAGQGLGVFLDLLRVNGLDLSATGSATLALIDPGLANEEEP